MLVAQSLLYEQDSFRCFSFVCTRPLISRAYCSPNYFSSCSTTKAPALSVGILYMKHWLTVDDKSGKADVYMEAFKTSSMITCHLLRVKRRWKMCNGLAVTWYEKRPWMNTSVRGRKLMTCVPWFEQDSFRTAVGWCTNMQLHEVGAAENK